MEKEIYKEKDSAYKKMLKLYGSVLTNLYIYDELFHCKSLIEIGEAEKRIKITFEEEKEYNSRHYSKRRCKNEKITSS